MKCPNCGVSLTASKSLSGIFYICPSCGGRSAGMQLMKKLGMPWNIYDLLYKTGRKIPEPFAKLCPHCNRKMPKCVLPNKLELDVCGRCQQIWFDPSEFIKLPFKMSVPEVRKIPLPTECEEAIAIAKASELEVPPQKIPATDFWNPDDCLYPPWLWFFSEGTVEINPRSKMGIPFITYSFSLIMIAVFALTFTGLHIVDRLGFIGDRWDRDYGVTIITSFFIHGGVFHLLSNLYFFMVFGDYVEDRLGKLKFFALLAASHIVGLISFALFDPHCPIPIIGASAGIVGVMAYYTICFPNAMVGFCLHGILWMSVPTFFATTIYIMFQVIGFFVQMNGFSGVNYLAHLGGMLVGIAAAVVELIKKRTKPVAVREMGIG